MNGCPSRCFVWSVFAAVLTIVLPPASARAEGPVNLARQAKVSAGAEYNGDYLAKFAVDGKVPGLLSGNDLRAAWVVPGGASKFQGSFTLVWDQPVEIAEIIYCGRTAMAVEECFKDYEVYIDGAAEPVTRGTFAMKHGPQRIRLPKSTASRVTIKFLSAYTSRYNPGASEIAVFGEPVSDEDLVDFGLPPGERTPEARQLAADLYSGRMGFRDVLVIHRHHLRLSHVYTYHVESFNPGGGLYVYSPSADGGKYRQLVDAGDGEIIDCDLSYDAKEVVFSWKRGGMKMAQPNQLLDDIDRSVPEDNYQVFRVNVDGTGLVQLTDEASNNLNACWLPDGGIAFISDRKPAYAYCYVTTSPVLYRMDRDGGKQKRLSANYLMDFTPSVLADGRIIFTRWEYVDRPACPIQSLWAINADGTGLSGYYGNRVLAPGTFMDAQPIPDTQKIICLATNHNGDCRGGICVIDPAKGANARESVRNVTPEVNIYVGTTGNGLNGPYEKPYPIDDGRYLVSKMGVIQLRDYEGNYVSLMHPKDGMGYYSAQAIRPLETPPVPSSIRLDESVQLAEDGSVSGSWSTMVLQDVYRGLEPTVNRGDVKQICVVQEIEKSTYTPLIHEVPTGKGYAANTAFGYQFPLVSCGATYSPKKVWGTIDVSEDGSACFQVPSEVPIYFLALDAEGRAVQRMRTFTHTMPGEVQSCVGCHADRNSLSPRPMNDLAILGQPQELEPPTWGVGGFQYPLVVQPVLDRHCIECHNEREHPKGIDLSGDRTDFFSVSYDILTRKGTGWADHPERHGSGQPVSPYTSWISTANGSELNVLEIEPYRWGSPASKLAEIIRTGHPDEDGKPRVDVPDAERRRVYLWIDVNVPYYGTSASNHRERMGSRRMLPPELAPTLAEVASRRCAECHASGVPHTFYTRMLKPENNGFLLAPLAQSAGGTEACGKAVFADTSDPDYQKLLDVFEPVQNLLKQRPRADMPGFVMPPCSTLRHTPLSAILPEE